MTTRGMYSSIVDISEQNSYLIPNEALRGIGPPYVKPGSFFDASDPTDPGKLAGSGLQMAGIPSPIVGKYIHLPDGTVTAPGLAWAGEVTSGRYRIGTANTGESILGDLKFDWNASRLRLDTGFSLDITDMTLGSVLFAGTSGRVSQDNTKFFWDDSNDRLGIGTNAPIRALEVRHSSIAQLVLSSSTTAGILFTGGSIGLTVEHYTNLGVAPFYHFTGDNNNLTTKLAVSNQHTTGATSHAALQVLTGDAAAGDPMVQYSVSFATAWTTGIDNSDSDKWKLSTGAVLGTNDRLVVDTSGNVYLKGSTYITGTSPWADVKAYGAVGDGVTNDTTAVQSAITALATSGGTVFFPPGTYLISTTLTLPDINITLQGAGDASIITIGATAISLFTIPVLTTKREIVFRDFNATGGSVAGQILFDNNDTSGLIYFLAENVRCSGFETVIDTQYDATYTEQSRLDVKRCFLVPTALAGSTLLKTPNASGSYVGNVEANFYDCYCVSASELGTGGNTYTLNVDGDVYLSNCIVPVTSGSAVNGLSTNKSSILMPNGDFTVNGSGGNTPCVISDTYLNNFPTAGTSSRLVFKEPFGHLDNSWFDGCHVQLKTVGQIKVTGCHFHPDTVSLGVSPYGIDIDSTSTNNVVTGCFFETATTAALRINGSTGNVVTGCRFVSSAARKTIQEVGAADNNVVNGCLGLDTGGGFTILGANTTLVTPYATNTSTTPQVVFDQASTGDCAIRQNLGSGNSWAFGIDNSSADSWKLSYGSAGNAVLGTNDYLTITTAGVVAIPTLTSGSVLFLGTGGAISQDNANLFWDDTNNRLGICTTGPDRKLDILDASGNPQIRLTYTDGSVYTELQTNSAGATIITNSGTIVQYAQSSVGNIIEWLAGNTDNTNAASSARMQMSVGGASAGDPFNMFVVQGVGGWCVGLDNSDSDKYKIGQGTTDVGAVERFGITAGGEAVFNDPAFAVNFRVEGASCPYMLYLDASATTENIALVTTAAPNWQTMDRGLFVGNTSTAPTGNPTGGGFLYSNAGAGTWRGTGGTITAFGPAGPHCGACGYDFWRVASHNDIWGASLRECGWCGKVYKSGPEKVLDRLDEQQRSELIYS